VVPLAGRWQAQEHLAFEFEDRTGLELCDKDGVLKEELPPIQRWLNRILALPIGLQNSIFDEFLSLVETRVSAARRLAGSMSVSRRSSSIPPP
jgi:hypothetical protein